QAAARRVPVFGWWGVVAPLVGTASGGPSLLWARGAVAPQVRWTAPSRPVAPPVTAELPRHARAGSVPPDARALQARWDSVIVARVLLMGVAVVALAAGLVRSAQ